MLKVFGFIRRNQQLTHDEYRAGHVGYHNSFGRRLNNIRGYLLNVRANRSLAESLGAAVAGSITRNEPGDFDDQWDGWGQLLFDSLEDYLAARSPARDRATPDGLQHDPDVAGVGGDFDYLYSGSPCQFHVSERVCTAVGRPERKLFKLAQFGKRRDGLAPELFEAYWSGRYASLIQHLPGLRGMVVNVRSPLDVMTGFFPPDAEGFTEAGIARREHFYSQWDGIAEYWFDSPENYAAARGNSALNEQLAELEDVLFERCFYREVDETVAVLPNRHPAPDFYYR
ncbi:MAG: EthD domain-containing protein [Pseudomonadales bacterium]